MGGAIASPSTAYVYDWNILPIGQQLWLKHLETYIAFPPLQDPASYNLEQVMAAGPQHEDRSRLTVADYAGRPVAGASAPARHAGRRRFRTGPPAVRGRRFIHTRK